MNSETTIHQILLANARNVDMDISHTKAMYGMAGVLEECMAKTNLRIPQLWLTEMLVLPVLANTTIVYRNMDWAVGVYMGYYVHLNNIVSGKVEVRLITQRTPQAIQQALFRIIAPQPIDLQDFETLKKDLTIKQWRQLYEYFEGS